MNDGPLIGPVNGYGPGFGAQTDTPERAASELAYGLARRGRRHPYLAGEVDDPAKHRIGWACAKTLARRSPQRVGRYGRQVSLRFPRFPHLATPAFTSTRGSLKITWNFPERRPGKTAVFHPTIDPFISSIRRHIGRSALRRGT